MPRYKFAFAVSLFFEYGGMQRTLLRIAQSCQARGHEVHVFTGGWHGERPEGIEVHVWNTRAWCNHCSNDILAKELVKETTCERYDCVIGFTKIPGLDVYYAGDPCFAARVDEDRPFWYKWTPRYRGLRRQEAAVFSRGADTEILLIAPQEQAKFIRYYRTESERFHLLPPGINKERLLSQRSSAEEAAEFRRSLAIPNDATMLLMVASRFSTKGVDRALHAIAAQPEGLRRRLHLVIVGGDRQGPYQRLAHRLQLQETVHFVGARHDMANFYASADLLVHPPYSENTGTVLIEAMLFGLPVLTTANCGFAFHVVNAEAGLICPLPYRQGVFNHLLQAMIERLPNADWGANGVHYCEQNDLYSLIEQATDVLIQSAARKHQ